MNDKNHQNRQWTNTSRQVARATKLCSVARNIRVSSVWNLLLVILMASIFNVATEFSGASVAPCTTKHGTAA